MPYVGPLEIIAGLLAGIAALATARVAGGRRRAVTATRPSAAVSSLPAGGGLVGLLRRRPWVRRSLSLASLSMAAVAVGMLGYPFYTDAYSRRVQVQLQRQLDTPAPALVQAFSVGTTAAAAEIEEGDSLTRIRIPSIGVDTVVVEGTTASALRAGAGHYRDSPLPCASQGNVAIAGHRTTYGRPFSDLDDLGPGDTITLTTPIGDCTYMVSAEPFVVEPSRWEVVANTSAAELTLTTCHPRGSAKQRLIVKAQLQVPAPAA